MDFMTGEEKRNIDRVIEALREGPKTVKDIKGKLKVSKSYVSRLLERPIEESIIKVTVAPRDKRKKRRGKFRFLYKLSPKARDPKWITLWRTASAEPNLDINVEEGLKSLTDDVENALLYMISQWWDEYEKGEAKFRSFLTKEDVKESEINEVALPQGLARYDFDVHMVWGMVRAVKEESFSFDDPEDPFQVLFMRHSSEPEKTFVEFCEGERENPNVFPSLKVAKDWNVEEQLSDLLEWISPLIEFPDVETYKGIDVGKWLRFSVSPPNYVAFIFRREQSKYIRECITPSWKHALKKGGYVKCSQASKGRKGGEKSR